MVRRRYECGEAFVGRKRAIGTRLPLSKSDSLNQVWSLDFLSDAFSDGRRFRVLGIMDQCSRECLTLVADTSIGGARVVRELDTLVARHGKPLCIVSDNGTELTSRAVLIWAQDNGIAWHYAGQANGERLYREPERQDQGRMPERKRVYKPRLRSAYHRSVAARLQQCPSTQQPRLPSPSAVPRQSAPDSCGRAACRLRSPSFMTILTQRLYFSVETYRGAGQQDQTYLDTKIELLK